MQNFILSYTSAARAVSLYSKDNGLTIIELKTLLVIAELMNNKYTFVSPADIIKILSLEINAGYVYKAIKKLIKLGYIEQVRKTNKIKRITSLYGLTAKGREKANKFYSLYSEILTEHEKHFI